MGFKTVYVCDITGYESSSSFDFVFIRITEQANPKILKLTLEKKSGPHSNKACAVIKKTVFRQLTDLAVQLDNPKAETVEAG